MKESELDWRICSRARLSRDPRFDGKFFIGVRGSGVYCRSICPAPTAKEKNCTYFATAAAAEEAGYRPCLRCRPESSPGTPAWAGTSTTVSRALRLIEESGIEDGGVESLAERLGVGSRHLRRLFVKHLGAPPNVIAQTRRLHFAKKLIDETNLPMTQLALAAGYGSVRRFNAAMMKTFHRTPTQIRSTRRTAELPDGEYVFRLRFRPPYDWEAMLGFLARQATPGVEAVASGRYRRSISLHGKEGCFEVSLNQERFELNARIRFGEPRALFVIVERIRAMFDLNGDWSMVEKALGVDSTFARLMRARPGLRVPGCWSPFELAVRAILQRALGPVEASHAMASLARTSGRLFHGNNGLTHVFPDAGAVANCNLAQSGVPRDCAVRIRALASAVCEGRLRFECVPDTEAFLEDLRAICDADDWTAQYVAMRALGEPDAFPVDRNFAGVERSDRWRPWRAYAAMYLWTEQAAAAGLPPRRTPADATGRAGWI